MGPSSARPALSAKARRPDFSTAPAPHISLSCFATVLCGAWPPPGPGRPSCLKVGLTTWHACLWLCLLNGTLLSCAAQPRCARRAGNHIGTRADSSCGTIATQNSPKGGNVRLTYHTAPGKALRWTRALGPRDMQHIQACHGGTLAHLAHLGTARVRYLALARARASSIQWQVTWRTYWRARDCICHLELVLLGTWRLVWP